MENLLHRHNRKNLLASKKKEQTWTKRSQKGGYKTKSCWSYQVKQGAIINKGVEKRASSQERSQKPLSICIRQRASILHREHSTIESVIICTK